MRVRQNYLTFRMNRAFCLENLPQIWLPMKRKGAERGKERGREDGEDENEGETKDSI